MSLLPFRFLYSPFLPNLAVIVCLLVIYTSTLPSSRSRIDCQLQNDGGCAFSLVHLPYACHSSWQNVLRIAHAPYVCSITLKINQGQKEEKTCSVLFQEGMQRYIRPTKHKMSLALAAFRSNSVPSPLKH